MRERSSSCRRPSISSPDASTLWHLKLVLIRVFRRLGLWVDTPPPKAHKVAVVVAVAELLERNSRQRGTRGQRLLIGGGIWTQRSSVCHCSKDSSLAMEAKGMKPENVAEALVYSAKRSLPGLSGGQYCCSHHAWYIDFSSIRKRAKGLPLKRLLTCYP
ncbi:unnamed protein product [Musa acuminata subsp. burmannicoides]